MIASVYALAGPPAAGTYPASYPYAAALADAAALNDVTSGANGRGRPAYLCTAGPGYDGPTGLGTPEGTGAFVHRASGTIAGRVTSAATGKPVAGAQVSVPGLATTTSGTGRYQLSRPAAGYRLTAADYGYRARSATVAVTAGATSHRSFRLAVVPRVTVGGTITDGSGHGWPLYAKVTWSDGAGHGGTAFTSPRTGRYRLSLLASSRYTLTVTSAYPGYRAATRKITVGSSGLTENASLAIDPLACSAPGYHPVKSGVTQPFGSDAASRGILQAFDGTAAPRGWTVHNISLHYPGYACGGLGVRRPRPPGQPHRRGRRLRDRRLGPRRRTPLPGHLPDLAGHRHVPLPQPRAAVPHRPAARGQLGRHRAGQHRRRAQLGHGMAQGRPAGVRGPAQVVVPLPQTADQRSARVRFGYLGEWSQYWEIDNVFLGNRVCARQPGGLLVGRVTNAATGAAINGATVASAAHPRQHATTVPTPGDEAIGGGLLAVHHRHRLPEVHRREDRLPRRRPEPRSSGRAR